MRGFKTIPNIYLGYIEVFFTLLKFFCLAAQFVLRERQFFARGAISSSVADALPPSLISADIREFVQDRTHSICEEAQQKCSHAKNSLLGSGEYALCNLST